MKPETRGIVICAGGYSYLTNAWILIHLLRRMGASLPIEVWGTGSDEFDDRLFVLFRLPGVRITWPMNSLNSNSIITGFGRGTRWQWALKPYSILNSDFDEVIYIDADSYPLRDPAFLFETPQYREHGAIFWPDLPSSFQTGPGNPIWDMMGVSYRQESEFETGQMAINKRRCLAPLKLALQMNLEPDKYYKVLLGDKDTFRFAWHKFGQSFAMPPFPVQPLEIPGGPPGIGVMCQHDFEGNRLFQHRNMAKWDLLGYNPQIPGYLYEKESFQFLKELREQWNGRLNWTPPKKSDFPDGNWVQREILVRDLLAGVWLLEDRRNRAVGCCGPGVPWGMERKGKPWFTAEMQAKSLKPHANQKLLHAAAEAASTADKASPQGVGMRGLRCGEVSFLADAVMGAGAGRGFYFWDLELVRKRWRLCISGEDSRSAELWKAKDGTWVGRWLGKAAEGQAKEATVIRLTRVETEYAILHSPAAKSQVGVRGNERLPFTKQKSIHQANHAFGIGDAVTGYYAAVQVAEASGKSVVYHTRMPEWLSRVRHPNVTITSSQPPKGTPDMDVDYAEQLRYAKDKTAWYRQWAGREFREAKVPVPKIRDWGIEPTIGIPRLDFPKYVILAPFAAWESRDWPQASWRRLAWLLDQAGYVPVAIGTKKEEVRLEETFNKSNAYWAVDHAPDWIMDAMLHADAVIGLDSGMVHLAGLLGVPTICIHAHLPPEFLFLCAPSVTSVTPDTSCAFCRWQGDRGFNEGCNKACSALITVGPEQVMTALLAPAFQKRQEKFAKKRKYAPEGSVKPPVVPPKTPAHQMPLRVPRYLWFTSKSKQIHPKAQECLESWHKQNPHWKMHLMDDSEAAAFVEKEYGGEIWAVYQDMPMGVMRADFWRYLVVYKFGGVYADTDTTAQEEIENWIGPEDGLVLGLEGGHPYINNWTFAATPGHPALKKVIDLVMRRARKGWQISNPELVHYHTGPGVFTDGVLGHMKQKPEGVPLKISGVHKGAKPAEGATRIYPPMTLAYGSVIHHFAAAGWGDGYDSWKAERDALFPDVKRKPGE